MRTIPETSSAIWELSQQHPHITKNYFRNIPRHLRAIPATSPEIQELSRNISRHLRAIRETSEDHPRGPSTISNITLEIWELFHEHLKIRQKTSSKIWGQFLSHPHRSESYLRNIPSLFELGDLKAMPETFSKIQELSSSYRIQYLLEIIFLLWFTSPMLSNGALIKLSTMQDTELRFWLNNQKRTYIETLVYIWKIQSNKQLVN